MKLKILLAASLALNLWYQFETKIIVTYGNYKCAVSGSKTTGFGWDYYSFFGEELFYIPKSVRCAK